MTKVTLPNFTASEPGVTNMRVWSHSIVLTAEEMTARIPAFGGDLSVHGIATLEHGKAGLEGQLVFSVGTGEAIRIEGVVDLMLIQLAARAGGQFHMKVPLLISTSDHATVSWSRGPNAPSRFIFCLVGIAHEIVK